MLTRPVDTKICCRFSRAGDFRANASIRGRQGIAWKLRPVTLDFGVKNFGPTRVDMVINFIHPFDVGTESRLACSIECEMNAEPAFDGYGINQTRERRLPGKGEIASARQI